jgi:hypothetical protein
MAKKKSASEGDITHRFLHEMSNAKRDEFVKDLDREIPYSQTSPLTPAMRRKWKAAQERGRAAIIARTAGRPRVGEGSQRIAVTVERNLLSEADSLASSRGISRAQLIAEGLRLALKLSGRRSIQRKAG